MQQILIKILNTIFFDLYLKSHEYVLWVIWFWLNKIDYSRQKYDFSSRNQGNNPTLTSTILGDFLNTYNVPHKVAYKMIS